MKRIIIFSICTVFSCGLFSSCSLEEENKSSALSLNYLKTETQYEELVAATYNQMRSLLRNKGLMFQGTDLYERWGEVNDFKDGIGDYTFIDTFEGNSWSFWVDNYNVINKANTALSRGENLGVSASLLKKRTGELLALRAYAYLNLVETFGGVPILTKEITEVQLSFTRDSEEAVYNKIVEDLDAVVTGAMVPDAPEKFGRVSMGMAKHLLGKVLLTRSYKSFAAADDLTKATGYFNDVIALHPTVANWKTLFGANDYVRDNTEAIFAVRFSTNVNFNAGWGNNMPQHFKFWIDQFPGNTHRGGPYYRHDLTYTPTLKYLELYEAGDVRASETYLVRSIIAGEAGSTTVQIGGSDVVKTWAVGDRVMYFPTTELTATEKDDYLTANPTVYLVINPSEYHNLQMGRSFTFCYPLIYKFFDPTINVYVGASDDPKGSRDIYVFRTAETKMLLAEAYLKAGNTAGAKTQIDDLRTRAGLGTFAGTVDIDAVLDESGRELFGESNRWMDLKRTGKLFARAWEFNAFVKKHNASAASIDSHFLLRPIPQQEIDRSDKTLKQNPGYTGAE